MEISWWDEHMFLDVSLRELPEELVEILRHGTNAQYLHTIALIALDHRWTALIYSSHRPLFVDICNRWFHESTRRFEPLNVVLALSRLLPLARHLSIYVVELVCRQHVDVFDILASKSATGLSGLPIGKLMDVLIIVNRLLDFDNHTFAVIVTPAQLQVLLSHSQLCVRYLAIRVLCSYLHAGDATFLEMVERFIGCKTIEGPWEGQTIDFAFYHLWEEKAHQELNTLLSASGAAEDRVQKGATAKRIIRDGDILPLSVSFGGVLAPSIHGSKPEHTSFVFTETTTNNLQITAKAIVGSRSVLVTGALGSGKSSTIRYIANYLGKASSMLTLHLNEQTDAKLLIGMYTSATTPGSFCWQPGILTTAVKEGRWVLIEDLDRAPVEVVSTLLPLLDTGELLVSNLGGVIRAAPGFKLIATIRSHTNAKGEDVIQSSGMLGVRHWTRAPLQKLSDEDLGVIIATRFPILHAYQPSIMSLYRAVRSIHYDSARASTTIQLQSRPQGPQDIIRYCKRVEALLTNAGVELGTEPISQALMDNIFMEAVDCFAGSIQSEAYRALIVANIAQELHVAPERADFCTQRRTPECINRNTAFQIGRAIVQKGPHKENTRPSRYKKGAPFATTDGVLRRLESIAVAVSMREPCLLVGETGTGKTTIVQELTTMSDHNLVVVNLSQQSEAGDLLGGYKPVNLRAIALPMLEEFEALFDSTFQINKNEKYFKTLARTIAKGQWTRTLTLWREALKMLESVFPPNIKNNSDQGSGKPKKRRKLDSPAILRLKPRWDNFTSQVEFFQKHVDNGSKGFSFAFMEGNIVKALRNGDWVLLDEINLASPDTLESIVDLLSDKADGPPSILLSETGNIEKVQAHPDFRIFASMNPATDVGKRDLPISLRSRFTEYYIEAQDKNLESLKQIAGVYLGSHVHGDAHVTTDVAQLYLNIKELSESNRLADGADQKPHYSLRTLTRTLLYVSDIAPLYGLRRALFEGFSMTFLTVLNKESELLVLPLINKFIMGNHRNAKALLQQIPHIPDNNKRYVQFRHYWLAQGPHPVEKQSHYIITPFIEANLRNLVRATSSRRFPVLLQGPTSSGKTSMLEYLAKLSGNKFVRINNHEHTDLQEYLGTYISDAEGQLQFQEGLLVRALREGHWIVLDELNLAPTDILEALNRLLDDNRELFIPETQEVVRPHENFMLFATQNPPGLYGGRKVLSRAFRNRFLELHFDDIPEGELETILRERTRIAPSYCTNIVNVYKRLALLRQSGRLFEQKNSFATLRDLFRWAFRDADDREQLAINGFMLLGERVRNSEERVVVKHVIEEVMRVKIDETRLYSQERLGFLDDMDVELGPDELNIVWTSSMRRLYILIAQALKNNEPVLLVGPTGCGKTSVCQALARNLHTELRVLNAHQNTETGDIIGGQRPIRNRSAIEAELLHDVTIILRETSESPLDLSLSVETAIDAYNDLSEAVRGHVPADVRLRVEQNISKARLLFEWTDGILVTAMKTGSYFLLDEISLADDSVLERLNSVLEPDRTLLLAEKGPFESLVTASKNFQFLATMNPGGDYGKKELSPALRNRFTEIWVPPVSSSDDILEIAEAKIIPSLRHFAKSMVEFATWYSATYKDDTSSASIRQILTWVNFVNLYGSRAPMFAILHGAAMVFIDGLGADPSAKLSVSTRSLMVERHECLAMMSKLFNFDMSTFYNEKPALSYTETSLMIGQFSLQRSRVTSASLRFNLEAPTTLANVLRIARALQLSKPILIEGTPGVGKTTLVTALANALGIPLTRINLSEQTDIMDLFGSDVPVEGESVGKFTWRDAPFLQAMKRGEWVLLDEMNLASQSVLEGLNACLDHRGVVYVPELDQSFFRHPKFALFAAQNPHRQGGGRKGLPASFVNRFTVVYADILSSTDYLAICEKLYPDVPEATTQALVRYVENLATLTQDTRGTIFNGGPWEFNLRDTLRWLHLLHELNKSTFVGKAADYQQLLFLQRFRDPTDVQKTSKALSLPEDINLSFHSRFHNLSALSYQCGLGILERKGKYQSQILNYGGQNLEILESLLLCVQNNWPCLLIGPSGSGKSSAIHHLASIGGAEVVELPLNADMDTMDLIGGYEQIDAQRLIADFARDLNSLVKQSAIDDVLSTVDNPKLNALLGLLDHALPNIDMIAELLRDIDTSVSDSRYTAMASRCGLLMQNLSVDNRPRFEWVDGLLIKALEQGHWLVLDNANLCSSSVLDRLNSLLEPSGVLAVHEYRGPDGSVRIVRPHKDFRLFLTMDPQHGELSRAMRNRCIELFLSAKNDAFERKVKIYDGDSVTFRFRTINRFDWNVYDDEFVCALASVCIDHFAIQDFDLVESWWSQVSKGLIDTPPSKLQLFFQVLRVYVHVFRQNGKISAGIWQLYENLAVKQANKKDFCRAQVSRWLPMVSLLYLADRMINIDYKSTKQRPIATP
jgi:midasin